MTLKKIKQQQIKKRFFGVKNSKPFKNLLNKYQLGNKKVLDLGCAYGEYLINFGNNSLGLTLNEKEVSFGKNVGLNIKKYNLEKNFHKQYSGYDVVFGNNIIEHINSPHNMLLNCINAVTKDGIVIIGVPIIALNGLVNKIFKGVYANDHVNFFTTKTIVKTIERAGLEILDYDLFYFKSKFLNKLLINLIPHIYIIAKKGNLVYCKKGVRAFY